MMARVSEQDRHMLFDTCFMKPGKLMKFASAPNVVLARHDPNGRAFIIDDEPKFFVCGFDTYVLDVAAS